MIKELFGVFCPKCKTKISLDKEELYGEDWIFCWHCGKSFTNPNYQGK